MSTREKGYFGEEVASEYLQSSGYEILEKNFTIKGGEIDIIAKDFDTLVFVEVKLRHGNEGAAEAVDSVKISRIVKSAEKYLFEKSDASENMKIRFDCIEVYIGKNIKGDKKVRINHIKNIDVT